MFASLLDGAAFQLDSPAFQQFAYRCRGVVFAGYGEFEYPLFLHGRDVDGLSAVAWLPFCCDSLGLDHPPIPESRVLFLQLLDVFGVEDEKQARVGDVETTDQHGER